MSAPSPPNPPAPNGRVTRNTYLRGLALGSIPLVIFWTFGGIAGAMQFANRASPWNYAGAGPLYLGIILGVGGLAVVLIATIVCLSRRNTRFQGYGLLTMLLVSPVLAVTGCQLFTAIVLAPPP